MASIIKFGSLVMNGEVCPFPTLRDGKDFWLGDTAEKHQIHWLVVDNKLVCCWNLITRLSWEELEAGRWASGKPVFLDGFSFGCRLLQQSDNGSNEWDRAMETCGGDNAAFHWRNCPSWTREKPHDFLFRKSQPDESCAGIARGGEKGADQYIAAGWRPVLVPLGQDSPHEEFLPGWDLLVWGNDFVLEGILQEQTQYDMLLRMRREVFLPESPAYRLFDDNYVAVDPAQVKFVQVARQKAG